MEPFEHVGFPDREIRALSDDPPDLPQLSGIDGFNGPICFGLAEFSNLFGSMSSGRSTLIHTMNCMCVSPEWIPGDQG